MHPASADKPFRSVRSVYPFTIMLNLKFALRTLFKTPFVTIVAIVSLALGIGANAAIFSLFNQMLLRPLPVPEPDRLVNLAAPGPEAGVDHRAARPATATTVFSYPMFRDLEKVQTVVHRHRRARDLRRQPRVRAARRRTARACSSRAAISRCSASRRRSAGCSAPDDDRDARRIARRRAQLRLLADALRRSIPAC